MFGFAVSKTNQDVQFDKHNCYLNGTIISTLLIIPVTRESALATVPNFSS